MKLKCEIIIEEVAGQKLAVPVGNGVSVSYFTVNSTGAYILELLKNEISFDEIITSIQNNFEVDDIPRVRSVVANYIEKLKKADVLE